MAKVCTGSYYGNDWGVYTREDAIACENAGGHVVDTGGSSCGATSIASMAAYPGNPSQGAVSELALTPLKLTREKFGRHPLVDALVSLNRAAASDIERIAAEDKKLQAEIVAAFIAVSGLATAVTQTPPPHGKLEPAVFSGLEKLARRIAERSSNESVRTGIEDVLRLARPYVGQDFAEIARRLVSDRDGESSTSSREVLLPSHAVATAQSNLHAIRTLATIDHGAPGLIQRNTLVVLHAVANTHQARQVPPHR
jgi:hypothetical protein